MQLVNILEIETKTQEKQICKPSKPSLEPLWHFSLYLSRSQNGMNIFGIKDLKSSYHSLYIQDKSVDM